MKKTFYLALAVLPFLAIGLAVFERAHAQTPCPTGAVPSDSARLCWTNALENVDGSPIPATGPTALKETRIRRSICNADGSFGAMIETITVPPDVGVALFSALPPARHCFQARHANNSDTLSDWSPLARKTTTAPAPAKPRQPNLTIA